MSALSRTVLMAAIAGAVVAAPLRLMAQTAATDPARDPIGVGVQGFGMAGLSWPSAPKSIDATGLDRRQVEVGGGLQVTRLWRELFEQVAVSRIRSEGERVFVNSAGEATTLCIPLTVKTSYLDISSGWTFPPYRYGGNTTVTPYAGAGAGYLRYAEQSPFAQPGDDVESSSVSYHVLGGIQVGLLRWVGVVADARYRWAPGVLGKGGVSEQFEEDEFGGFQLKFGVWVGFGGGRGPRTPSEAPTPNEPMRPVSDPPKTVERPEDSDKGVIISSAPVFLRADATLEPLRILEPGTSVRIRAENADWIQIEFADALLGPRVGFVQRKHIRLPKS
jgi:opacity protein-like surface antigen